MPEIAEVSNFRIALGKEFTGQSLISIEIIGGKFINSGIELLRETKFPLTNTSILNSGKFLYFIFNEDVVIFSSLGMTGSYGERNKHSAIKIYFDNKSIYYNDIRRFGNFRIGNKAQLITKLNTLGWDPFQVQDIPDWFIPKIRRHNNKKICVILLDQSLFNGAGNYLKNEILYECKIHPNTLVNSLTDEQLIALANSYKNIATKALEAGGASFSTYKNMYGNYGDFSKHFKIYKQKIDPLGNKVIKIISADKRSTYYVPEIQKIL